MHNHFNCLSFCIGLSIPAIENMVACVILLFLLKDLMVSKIGCFWSWIINAILLIIVWSCIVALMKDLHAQTLTLFISPWMLPDFLRTFPFSVMLFEPRCTSFIGWSNLCTWIHQTVWDSPRPYVSYSEVIHASRWSLLFD